MSNKGINRFAQWLDKYREEHHLSVREMAQKCGLSSAFMGFLINGDRLPSLDTIFKIADGLEIPFEEIVFQFVNLNGSDGGRIRYLKVNNARKKKDDVDGILTVVTKEELNKFYGTDVSADYPKFIKLYLRDLVYKEDYVRYEKEKFLNKVMSDDQPLSAKEILLRDVLSNLYELDETSLRYIQEQIDTFIKYWRRDPILFPLNKS